MQSDFEKEAAQAAVEAVERRYERNRRQEQRMHRRRRLGPVVIVIALLAGGVWFWQNFAGGDLPSLLSLSSLTELFSSPTDAASADRNGYGEALKLLLTGEVKLSSEMLEELSLKAKKPGVRYAVLTPPAKGWFGLYALARDEAGRLVIRELSPVSAPRQVTGADLRAACAGKPYLVAVGGTVYLFGSRNLADATHLRSEVQRCVGAGALARIR